MSDQTPQTPATPEQVHAAVAALKAALDFHLAAVEARSGENDPAVQAAYDALASAAEAYDDVLFTAYEEVTPFGPVESDDDLDEDEDTDEDIEGVDEVDDTDDEDDEDDTDDEDDDLEWESEPESE